MEHCENCEYWERHKRNYTHSGICDEFKIDAGHLVPRMKGGFSFETPERFGCNEFKEKPKGPFTAEKRRGSICEVWDVDVHFPGHDSHWLSKGTQKQATELARFLNARWTERRE